MLDGDRIDYRVEGTQVDGRRAIMEIPNALYAFAEGNTVSYIGKTTRGIRRRFAGYRRPGATQRTNVRCNAKIKEAIGAGRVIRILAFTPITQLRYGEFEINLAAGLEDSLIRLVNPSWNGGDRGAAITETAEREAWEDGESLAEEPGRDGTGSQDSMPIAQFRIILAPTYYERGIVNPGVEASRYLGEDGEPVIIHFSDNASPLSSSINRTANKSGAVRLVGSNRQIAEWFQRHFRRGDPVTCEILDAHTIRFCSPKSRTDEKTEET
nr:GIY-YIG nuclease family protein [Rubellimicrobium arenae]